MIGAIIKRNLVGKTITTLKFWLLIKFIYVFAGCWKYNVNLCNNYHNIM